MPATSKVVPIVRAALVDQIAKMKAPKQAKKPVFKKGGKAIKQQR